jgi:CHAT domain-containing protein/tetratricopeptide (TPR) repeat protein
MVTRPRRVGVLGVLGLAVLLQGGFGLRADAPRQDPFVPLLQALRSGDRGEARRVAASLQRQILSGSNRPAQIRDLGRLGRDCLDWGCTDVAADCFNQTFRIAGAIDPGRDLLGSKLREALGEERALSEYAVPLKHIYQGEAEVFLSLVALDAQDYATAARRLASARSHADEAANFRSPSSGRQLLINLLNDLRCNEATLAERTGQYEEAEGYYNEALKLFGTDPGSLPRVGRIRYAEALNSRGWLRAIWGNRHRALAEAARAEQRDADGARESATAQAKYRLALADVEEARRHWEALRPGTELKVARGLNNLGLLHYFLGDFAQGERLCRQGLAVLEDRNQLGPNHPEVALLKHNLAAMLRSRGDFTGAGRLHRESLRTYEKVQGAKHLDVAVAHGYLAWVHAAGRDWPSAAVEMDEARRLFREHIWRVLSAQSEAQQLTFLETKDRPQFHAALTLALRAAEPGQAAASPEALAQIQRSSAEWLCNGKSVTPDVLGARPAQVRASGNPRAGTVYRRLRDVRDQLAAEAWRRAAGPKGTAGSDDLVEKEARLARELALELADVPLPGWVDLPEVQRVLAADPARGGLGGDAVLIDVARFRLIDFRSRGTDFIGTEEHYAAWVTPPDGPVKVFDLGPAWDIDHAVADLRRDIEEQTKTPQTGKAGEVRFKAKSKALADRLLGPMYDYVGRYRRWVVSPDGDLWLVPWAALVLPAGNQAGSYAVEKHTLSFVASGRDVVAAARGAPAARGGGPLVFANPDFGRGKTRLSFPALPATALEAREIAPLLAEYTGTSRDQVVPLTGADARERTFRDAHGPRAVVLATHGFFLDKEANLPANPFLRCGLALAGANQALGAPSADDDGILLGQEILDTDLRGTDLVVLGACETAVGKVRDGEGVANLQSAFQLAGARTVVATLWEVPDLDTAFLLRDFFRNLVKGKDKAESLRQAQVERIKALRASPQRAAHPFRWASATLTGQWAASPGK